MTIYAGLDVSDSSTHICVVDGDSAVLRRDVQATDHDVLAKWLNAEFRGRHRIPGTRRTLENSGDAILNS
jgi:transposase